MKKTLLEQLNYISQSKPLTESFGEMDKYMNALNDLGEILKEILHKMNVQGLSMSLNTDTFLDSSFESMYLLPPKFKINGLRIDIDEVLKSASGDSKGETSQLSAFDSQLKNMFNLRYVPVPIWLTVTEKEFVIKNM